MSEFEPMVFRLVDGGGRFHAFAFVDESLDRLYLEADGRSFQASWPYPAISVADADDEPRTFGDFAMLGTMPIFSEAAVGALEDLLRASGELLPLRFDSPRYWAHNVTTVVPALDESRSGIVRFSSGRVLKVEHFAFKREELDDVSVFKLPQLLRTHVFVTLPFVRRVQAAGLSGFGFEPLEESADIA
jgi:hypothetical protein